jgi:hypothetical protein
MIRHFKGVSEMKDCLFELEADVYEWLVTVLYLKHKGKKKRKKYRLRAINRQILIQPYIIFVMIKVKFSLKCSS